MLIITGTGFGTDINEVAVIVGGVACSAVALTDTEIKCSLGEREGGLADLQVNVKFLPCIEKYCDITAIITRNLWVQSVSADRFGCSVSESRERLSLESNQRQHEMSVLPGSVFNRSALQKKQCRVPSLSKRSLEDKILQNENYLYCLKTSGVKSSRKL